MGRLTHIVAAWCAIGFCGSANASPRDIAFATSGDVRMAGRAATFIGFSYKVNFGGKSAGPRGRASVGISPMAYGGDGSRRIGNGLEFTATKGEPAALSIGSVSTNRLKRTANMDGSSKTILIVTGVVAALGVGALLVLDAARECHDTECE